MRTSKKGMDFIKKFEGIQLIPYKCAAGVWTVGIGHTPQNDIGPITEKQAYDLLAYDCLIMENCINKYVKIQLSQTMFDALVAFIFNVGPRAFQNSTLLKEINLNDMDGIKYEWLRWDKANGKPVPGLTRRRKAELSLFLTGNYL